MRIKLFIVLALIVFLSGGFKKSEEMINSKNEVKIISNPEYPKDGIYDLVLDELFTLGNQKDNSKYLFTEIRNVDIDKDGNIYVLDKQSKIFVFNKQGKFLRKFGQNGSGPGDFNVNCDFAVTNKNNIVLTDPVNYRYCYFDFHGKCLNIIKVQKFFNNLLLDQEGNIYSSDQDIDRKKIKIIPQLTKMERYSMINTIYKYSINTKKTSTFGAFTGEQQLFAPTKMGGTDWGGTINEFIWKISPKGFLITGDANSYLFSKYDMNGKLTEKFGRKYSRLVNKKNKSNSDDFGYLPVFTKFSQFDAEGNFWVNLNTGGKTEYFTYDVFSKDGIFQKQVYSKHIVKLFKENKASAVISRKDNPLVIKIFKYSLKKRK